MAYAKLTTILVLELLFGFLPAGPARATNRPNVVILLADDLGWKDIGCYGGPVKTPALDSLAARGMRFTDFHSGAAVCSPSRATLLTGRHHVRTGVYSWINDNDQDSHLLESETTLAEILKGQGYETAHFGKWHLGFSVGKRIKPSPSDHGFDYWYATVNGASPSHRNPNNFIRNGEKVGQQNGYSCHLVVDEAIRWLDEERKSDAPFFLNLWFHEPHAPIAAPDEIVVDYGKTNDAAAIYSGTIDNTDSAIDRLLLQLEKTGILENTLIVYSSDNGSYRQDRVGPLREKKGSNYEGGTRVPGIFFWKDKIPAGKVEDEPAGLIDIVPTVCGILEIDPPESKALDGSDLTPLLTGGQSTIKRQQPLAFISPLAGSALALREGKYSLIGHKNGEYPRDRAAMASLRSQIVDILRKDGDPNPESTVQEKLFEGFANKEADRLRGQYIRHNQFHESWIPSIKAMKFNRFELYDLSKDISQKTDIAKEQPEVFERLKKQLLEIAADVIAEGPNWGNSSAPPVKSKPKQKPTASAEKRGSLKESITPLIDASCIECHDEDTKTGLDFYDLAFDLSNPKTFRRWEKVFDQIDSGKMPPKKKARPDPELKETALDALYQNLRAVSLAKQRENGRVPVRRLTRTEYEYTLHDLLGIGSDLASKLPPENLTAIFDTVAAAQGISPVHIRSYLAAADLALDEAIELGPRPRMEPRQIDYRNHSYVQMWFERELRRGGNTVLRTDDAFVTFDGRPHTTRTDNMGIRFPVAGRYRIAAEAYAYQATTPVTFCIYRGNDRAGTAELIGSWQIDPGSPKTVDIEHYFSPGDYFYLAPADLDELPGGKNVFSFGARQYPGEGLAIRRLTMEGPLEKQWPPERTRQLLGEVDYRAGSDGRYEIIPQREPLAQITDIISRFAPTAFRSPLQHQEVKSWVSLAEPALQKGRDFEEALRVVLRAMLSSPEFLYHSNNPGKLDDYALATRLSYFLWKSLPDDQLFLLAAEGKLSQPTILASEVNRMLDDEKAHRFIRDFLNQWLELKNIDATSPDEKLYPEYDDVLRQAILEETHRFFAELIWNDRGIRELIDTNYTFLNCRLAKHYGIPGVEGLKFRKVMLPASSPRGGLLTQAGILKVTANGTNTSPVPRGNFVLSRLLGTPPSPPPKGIGAVVPDTRGTTTIREELAAHRDVASCANCHRYIDPPGFALESFDPIGGFRTRYRSSEGDRPDGKLFGRAIREYRLGPDVDATGITAEGEKFSGIREFKKLLLTKEDQIARHFLRSLITYATGAEIQFTDREELEELLTAAKDDHYGVRSLIRSVVQSQIFRNK